MHTNISNTIPLEVRQSSTVLSFEKKLKTILSTKFTKAPFRLGACARFSGKDTDWSEHSFLLVPAQKSGHRAPARALPPRVVLGHRSRTRELVRTRCWWFPRFFPMLPYKAVTKMAAGVKWTSEEIIALLDAYSEKSVQDYIEGMASNKNVNEEIQKIMKEESGIERTTQDRK